MIASQSHLGHAWVVLSACFAPAHDSDWAKHRAIFNGSPPPAKIDDPTLLLRILPVIWRSLRPREV